MDTHYTPQLLARELVASAADLHPTLIADLAAGGGDLLLEAERIWPQASFLASDIDRGAVRRLRLLKGNWRIGRCDLRNPRSRARCSVLKDALGSVSLLLLNPPFSCRGGTRFRIETPDGDLHASAAMSFVLTAMQYLHEDGTVVAVLPSGCLHNLKDRAAWKHVRRKYSACIVADHSMRAFPSSAASTAIVRLSPRRSRHVSLTDTRGVEAANSNLTVRVVRGCHPMYEAKWGLRGHVLVHSTDLRRATVHLNGRRASRSGRLVNGPAVLMPRVGQITVEKIALYRWSTPIVMSDCVIALTTLSLTQARAVQQRLVDGFLTLKSHYVGTGAPFITLDRLQIALQSIGITAHER